MIVWQILMRTPYDLDNPERLGIIRLLSNDIYKAAYPLHDSRYDQDGPNGELGTRRVSWR